MKRIIIIWGFFLPISLWAQITISGIVREAVSGEQIAYAKVEVLNSTQGVLTNEYGFYSISLNPGAQRLLFFREGYTPYPLNLNLQNDTLIDIYLQASNYEIDTVAIEAQRLENSQTHAVSRIVIPIQQLKAMPVLGGEADVMKGLQLLPGVQFGQEGTSGLFVRGGSPDQNLILLDDMPVYNVNHLFGLFSLFPPQTIKDVELIKGGFPAQYGGRLSSVVRMQTKDGNQSSWKKQLSLGLLSGQFTLDGPLIKNRASLFVAGRRSWLDLLLRPFSSYSYQQEDIDGNAAYGFYDVVAKVSYQPTPKDKIYLSFYTGRDRGRIRIAFDIPTTEERFLSENQLQWGNITTSLRYQRILGKKLFGQSLLGYTRYLYQTRLRSEASIQNSNTVLNSTSLTQGSSIADIIFKQSFDYYASSKLHYQAGVQWSQKRFLPEVSLFQSQALQTIIDTSFNQLPFFSQTYAIYLSQTFRPSERIDVYSGLRAELFSAQDLNEPSLQGRLNLRYALNEKHSIKAAYSYIKQYLHLLTNSGLGLPTDLWVPATSEIKPSDSHQFVLGYYHDLPQFSFSGEVYYKTLNNVIEYADGASFFNSFDAWESQVVQGVGRSYGLELFAHRPYGKFNGWLSYTLAWHQRQFTEINEGAWFPFRYDRRHNLALFMAYNLPKPGRSISASFTFLSGARATVPIELASTPYDIFADLQGSVDNLITLYNTYTFGEVYGYSPERNNFQMSPFHKIDLAYSTKKEKKHWLRTWTFGIYNLYGQRNPYYLFYQRTLDFQNSSGDEVPVRSQLTEYSFLIWLPYFNWSIEF
ncbi:MAG: TonB-dependent receptor plug domain-containing protein [Bacteroidota bacterium]